jgi:hypothetical protein
MVGEINFWHFLQRLWFNLVLFLCAAEMTVETVLPFVVSQIEITRIPVAKPPQEINLILSFKPHENNHKN